MSKLKKFDQLYNNIIFQTTQFKQNFVKEINNCDSFLKTYLQPLEQKCNVLLSKQRYNVFKVFGIPKQIYKFFNALKVDKDFCKDINGNLFEFKVLSPLICLCDTVHYYNNGIDEIIFDRTHSEGNQLITAGQRVRTTKEQDDIALSKIEGKWYKLFSNEETIQNVPDYVLDKEIHSCTPKELNKAIQTFLKVNNVDKIDNLQLYVEFTVNCDKLPNNCFGQTAQQVRVTFSGQKKSIKDISDKLNDPNRMTQPTAKCKMPPSKQKALVNQTEKVLKKTKKTKYSK